MHEHHDHHIHEFLYCEACDVVYCRCGKEWLKPCDKEHYPLWFAYPNTTTSNDTGNWTFSCNPCPGTCASCGNV